MGLREGECVGLARMSAGIFFIFWLAFGNESKLISAI